MNEGIDRRQLSPGNLPYVLDNATVWALYQAGALERVLHVWPRRWLVPLEAQTEVEAWPREGSRVGRSIANLCDQGIVSITCVEPQHEGRLYEQLSRSLGPGESEVIAIAAHRQFGAVLDDPVARRACDYLRPKVPYLDVGEILHIAHDEGKLTAAEVRAIRRNALGFSESSDRV